MRCTSVALDFPATPSVVRGGAAAWECEQFAERLLTGDLASTVTSWRVGPISETLKLGTSSPSSSSSDSHSIVTVMETECDHIEASFSEFYQWLTLTDDIRAEQLAANAFVNLPSPSVCDRRGIFIYADYKHFCELFPAEEEQEDIGDRPLETKGPVSFGRWHELGIEELDPSECTLWLGTRHSHTPLHYDTYGNNVVVQLVGCKRWRLWKPDVVGRRGPSSTTQTGNNREIDIKGGDGAQTIDGDKLSNKPSEVNLRTIGRFQSLRIPYEESSVYNSYDPRGQNVLIPPDFEVLLGPGDVLFVPKHWWHFVETESDYALSVNVWKPVKDDTIDQLSEAMVRFVFGALKGALDEAELTTPRSIGWISPSEYGSHDTQEGEEPVHQESKGVAKGYLDPSNVTNHHANIQYLISAMSNAGILDLGRSDTKSSTHSDYRQIESKFKLLLNSLLQKDVIQKCVEEVEKERFY